MWGTNTSLGTVTITVRIPSSWMFSTFPASPHA